VCRPWWGLWFVVLPAIGLIASGCHGRRRAEPVSVPNLTLGTMTIAVAPALNLSGSASFDENRFADLLASELSYAEGISVIPVSRVLGVLAAEGLSGVESPSHALELVGLLGADGILVVAVTEYDPYDPPIIGISAQLYGTRPGSGGGSLDPVALSRRARLAAGDVSSSPPRLLGQTQRVFDASHGSVVKEIQAFAELRSADNGPYGWRKFVVSQQHYIRYCCHATIRALLEGQHESVLTGEGPER
jgi:hypothetical protein